MSNVNTMDTTYGALLIAIIICASLYGITVLQTFLYYRQYPNDSRFMKLMVFLLWVLDTTHLILSLIALYTYLISNFGNPYFLGQSTWSMNLQIDCIGLIGLIVQCFFARRVLILTKNTVFPVIIVILASMYFCLGVYFTVETFVLVDIAKFSRLFWVAGTGMGSAAAADVIIAATLCRYLGKSRTGSAETDSLITTLIIYSLTTGLITSFLALLNVFLFVAMPNNCLYVGVFWILGKCYVNSLLATLNSRDAFRARLDQRRNTLVHVSPFVANSESPSTTRDAKKSQSVKGDMNKEYSDVGMASLAVQPAQMQTNSRTDNSGHFVFVPPTAMEV